MSIAPNRVVARIVEEVAGAARIELDRALLAPCSRGSAANSRVHVEVARASIRPAPPCASLFHFWTHALRAFLDEAGHVDQLRDAASAALCARLEPPELERALRSIAARAGVEPARLAPASGARAPRVEAYCMIDGRCRGSLVAASDREWWAVSWAHGSDRRPVR